MNITKAQKIYFFLLALLLAIIFNRYFSIIAINTFLFFDNILNVSQSISPFILWGILGLLVGTVYGTFVAWKKYTLDFKLNLIPIIFLFQILFLLYIYNQPLKNGISTGIPNPESTAENTQIPIDTIVATKPPSSDAKQNSTSSPNKANNPNNSKKPVPIVTEFKTYTGSIGKLSVIYKIKRLSDGTLDGTYYYTSHARYIFTLKGKELDGGRILLTEYTNGKITAHCTLKNDNVCFSGKMNNTDGRHFDMKMCEPTPVASVTKPKSTTPDLNGNLNFKLPSIPQLKQYLVGKTLCGIACNGSDEISAFVMDQPDVQKEQIVVRASFIVKDLDRGESENCSGDYVFFKDAGECKFSKFISN